MPLQAIRMKLYEKNKLSGSVTVGIFVENRKP